MASDLITIPKTPKTLHRPLVFLAAYSKPHGSNVGKEPLHKERSPYPVNVAHEKHPMCASAGLRFSRIEEPKKCDL